MQILANRLKYERKLQGKKQEEMAQLLNVKRATYGEYERGKNLPPIDKLKLLAENLNVSVDYLVGNTEKRIDLNELSKQVETMQMIACTIQNLLKG